MKKKYLLLVIILVFCDLHAQLPKNTATFNQPIVDSYVHDGFTYTIELVKSERNGYIKKLDADKNVIASGVFPNHNSNRELHSVIPREVMVSNEIVVTTAVTWSGIGFNGNLFLSNSLIVTSDNFEMPLIENRLTTLNSAIRSIFIQGDYVYFLCIAIDPTAKIGFSTDGHTITNEIVENPGNGEFARTWFCAYNWKNNSVDSFLSVASILQKGTTSSFSMVNLRRLNHKMTLLSNGYIAFGYVVGTGETAQDYLAVVDPNNLTTDANGDLQTVHTFGPYTNAGKLSITYCNNRYVVANYNDYSLTAYDNEFNVTARSYKYDFSFEGKPAELECLSDGDIKLFMGMGNSPLAETPHAWVMDTNLVMKYMRGGFGGEQPFPFNGTLESWVEYYKAHPVNDTEVLMVANYKGAGLPRFGDTSIPSCTETKGVMFTVEQTAPEQRLTFNNSLVEFKEVLMNKRLDPDDSNKLIDCGDCTEGYIVLDPSVNLKDDLTYVPEFLGAVNVPAGYEIFMLNMGTDTTKPVGYQRFLRVVVIPIGTVYSAQSSDGYLSAKLYFTKNQQVLNVDDNFDDPTFAVYPNPVINNLNIRSQKIIKNVQVYNMMGQMVKKSNSSSGDLYRIDLSHLRSGMYLAHIFAEDGSSITKKVFKE